MNPSINPVNILFPRRCPLCDSLISPKGDPVCKACVRKIRFLENPCLEKDKSEPKRKQIRSLWVDDFAAAFEYKDEIRESVLRFKYSGRAEYAAFYGAAMWACAKDWILQLNSDLILPIPADKRRLRERGYNQAELLAKEIGRLSGITQDGKLLLRIKRTKPQKGLDSIERKLNLASAFSCTKNPPKRILVVDDILTTGSTIEEAAKCLKNAGAEKVFALCLCVD